MTQQVITFLILGLGEGALIAAIGLGVVLTYRGSGVVNFATGAMAMYTSYGYSDLRLHGELFMPPLPVGLLFAHRILMVADQVLSEDQFANFGRCGGNQIHFSRRGVVTQGFRS